MGGRGGSYARACEVDPINRMDSSNKFFMMVSPVALSSQFYSLIRQLACQSGHPD